MARGPQNTAVGMSPQGSGSVSPPQTFQTDPALGRAGD